MGSGFDHAGLQGGDDWDLDGLAAVDAGSPLESEIGRCRLVLRQRQRLRQHLRRRHGWPCRESRKLEPQEQKAQDDLASIG